MVCVDGEGLPSSMIWKWRIPMKHARSSRSKAEHLTWASSNFLEKKPSDSQPGDPARFYGRQAPMCVAEASTARLSFAPWTGCASLVAEVSICLTSVKAASLSPFHSTAVGPFGPPRRQSVSGFSSLAAPGRKRR